MLRNFLKAGIGGAGSQAINFLALPVISRLYAPKDYAVWAIIMASSSILGSIACLRYELAIVIPYDDEEASSLFWLCVILTGFFAAIAILPSIINEKFLFNSFPFGGTSILIAVGVALDTVQQVESHLLMRHYKGFIKTGG